jgi:hypothetical protein
MVLVQLLVALVSAEPRHEMNEGGPHQSSQCGGPTSVRGIRTTAKSVASTLMLGVEKMTDRDNLSRQFDVLARVWRDLPELERRGGLEEIKWFALFMATVRVGEAGHSSATVKASIVQEMASLYGHSLAFRDMEPKGANRLVNECTCRLDAYHQVIADFVKKPDVNRDIWFLALARAAEKRCYRVEAGDAVWELVLMIGYFSKVLHGVMESMLGGGAQGHSPGKIC